MKLTKPQKQIYDMESFIKGSVSCVCGCMLLDIEKTEAEINAALNIIYRKNDALRIRVRKNADSVYQDITDFEERYIPALRFNSKKDLDVYATDYAKIPFLLDGTLSEIVPVILPGYSGILIKLHHIISDGWTCALVASQMKLLLTGYMTEAYSYADYITYEKEYLNSKRYQKDKEYFAEKINECSEPMFISSKPDISYSSERISFNIDITELLEVFSKNYNTSVFAVFLTVISFYFSRIKNNSTEFFLGTTVINRNGEKERNTMGMYANTVPVLMVLDYNTTVIDNIQAVTAEVLSVLRHQKFNYTDVIKELNKGKLFDVVVNYQNAQIVNGETIIEWYHNGAQAESLQIHIEDHNADGTLKIHYDYRLDKFSKEDVVAMHDRIFKLLNYVIEHPDKKISDLEMLSNEEKQKLLCDFNNTSADYPRDKCAHKLFEEQVEKSPDKIAVVACDKTLTYKQLGEEANRIANALIEKGVGKGDIVAFVLPRRSFLIATMLGILKTGAAYMPVDPDYPQERIEYMLSDSKAKFCVTEDNISELLSYANTSNPDVNMSSADICYCIYTSGSTGKPKGTLLTHRNIVNYVSDNEKNVCHGITKKNCRSILSVTTVGFDIFVTESLLPLTNGMEMVLANEEQAKLQSKLNELIKVNPVDVMQTTPTKMKTLITDKNQLDYLKTVKTLILGGEALDSSLVEELKGLTDAEIFNIYGPTEATVWVTNAKIESKDAITIGKPMANTQIYIVDKYMNPVPIGVTGELCIAGDCVGAGYLGRPELTAEKFVDNPFGEGKLYKTGDLAYWREDGNIIFCGRNDFQVKIRGLRIELGEIENAVSSVDGINLSVVVVRKNSEGRQLICAFYTGEEKTAQEIKTVIGEKLPKYMLPHIFIHLKEMPLTSSGKINRKALPEIDLENIQTGVEYVAPETEKEKALIEAAEEVLGCEKISVLDNFFDLGGDSLKAIELTAKLEAKDYTVSVKTIFSSKDIKSLAEALTSEEKEHIKVEYGKAIPATAAQMRVYTSQFVAPESAHYNVPIAFRVKELNPEKLNKAVNRLVEKHESLRTRFETENGKVNQIIEDKVRIEAERLSSDDITLFNTPFDLEKAPLIKVGYFENTVMIVAHHIVVDGESTRVLLRDLNEFYMERDTAEVIQYGEFAVTDGYTEENEKYWTQIFSEETVPLELKKDFARPEKQSFKGSQIYELIDEGLHNRITAVCKQLNITNFVFYMACYNILLSKYSGNVDIVVGTPINGRNSRFLNSVGMFVNTIAMRSKPQSNKKISELLSEIKKASIEAIDNQNYPFDKLVKKLAVNTLGRNPLFDVMFAYQGEQLSEVTFGDAEAEVLPIPLAGVKCDMNFNIIARKTDVVLIVEYSTDLFKENTVKEFISAYRKILEQALDTDEDIGNIDIISDEEKKKELYDFNDTKHSFDVPEKATLYSLFEKTASGNKEKVCIKTAARNLTFGELLNISESLDLKLRKITGDKKSVIAVIAERSAEMYTAIYGIIRGGNAYLPIDPKYPQERIDRILSDSNAAAVAAQGKFIKLAGDVPVVDMTKFISVGNRASNSVKCEAEPDDTAYVIYTSGSTGNPKGAMVSHKSAVNRILWMHDKYPLGNNDAILQKTPYTFDVSVWEIFWWGICGGCLAASKPDEHFIPAKILDEVYNNNVTHLHFVPSVFEIFLGYLENHTEEQSKFSTVKYVFVSGEVLTANLVERFYKLYPYDKVTLHNLYGPTECAVDVTYYDCRPGDVDPVPIGKPIYNTQLYVADKNMKNVPIGVTGELCIAGVNVGQGYLNNAELTAEKFIDNPFGEGKLYKTGDLAYWREDGNIIFCGRIDSQIKLNGQRIEIGEIENAINEAKGVESAVVIVRKVNSSDMLVAFYTGSADAKDRIKAACADKLPGYMVPSVFMHLGKLPLNQNGKLDRKALSEIQIEFSLDKEETAEPTTLTESFICDKYKAVLGKDNIGRNSDFFENGGTSLSMISLLSEKGFEGITAAEFMGHPTPAKLAIIMDGKAESKFEYLEVLHIAEKSDRALILLPFAGGGAEAYGKFLDSLKKKDKNSSVYFIRYLHSEDECRKAASEIASRLNGKEISIYSHCVGAAVALYIIKALEESGTTVKQYFAAAAIPPAKLTEKNMWRAVPDRILEAVLSKAGAQFKELSKEKRSELLRRFREDTDFANVAYAGFKGKIKAPVSVIISKDDIFTKNYRQAENLWLRYIQNLKGINFISSESHYFQRDDSDSLIKIILG